MGPVNWLAVVLAAALAAALRIVWHRFGRTASGRLASKGRGLEGGRQPWRGLGLIVLLAVPAAMFGHMFARLTPGKPWLYFMMTGGVALTFVLPALWLALARGGAAGREIAVEAGYWPAAFLGMGAVFWALS